MASVLIPRRARAVAAALATEERPAARMALAEPEHPRAAAQRARLRAAFGPAVPGAAAAQLNRSKNPRRQDDDAYSADVAGLADEPLTEHHIVPHAKLARCINRVKGFDESPYMPSWAEVTIRELCNLKGGLKLEWIQAYNRAPPQGHGAIAMDDLASNRRPALRAYFEQLPQSDEDRREALRLLKDGVVDGSFRGGEEPDKAWAGAYLEWLPGNIVLGPTKRAFDQGDGDKVDKELVALLRAMGRGAHADAAMALDAALDAMDAGVTPEKTQTMRDCLDRLAGFAYTAFDATQQAQWTNAAKGLHVIGYVGN